MDIETAASYAEIIGLVTILGAAVYSWYQIREMKASRDSAAALVLSEHFQRPAWVGGVVELVYQPKGLDSLETFKEHHGERWPDLFAVMATWESMGALVHRGDLDFHLVYDLYSGLILSTHEVCEPLIQGERDKFDNTRFEWFTWLADRIREFNDSQHVPEAAYLEHRNWKPPVRKPN
tara:strand:- start:211 stop:744 length:534 start_codon:yes stop_codon:yes gene_type:complete